MKLKDKTTEVVTTTKRIVINGEAFVQAVAMAWLVVVAVIALQDPQAVTGFLHRNEYQWLTAISAAVIGVRAFLEFVKFLDR